MSVTSPTAPATAPSPVPRGAVLAMLVVAFAAFMDLLDVGIVTVVIPVIQKDLGGSYAQGQWFLVAYVVAFAVVLVAGGRLGDRYGRKRIFLIGVAGFSLFSLFCAVAQTPDQLILFRFLQGGFGALMTPQVFAIMQVLFPPAKRAVGFTIYGAVINIAQLGAPLLGGVLSTYGVFGLGWRTIFLINVPIGVLIIIGAVRLVPESRAQRRPRNDFLGILLIGAATAAIIYPLQEGREKGWPAWMIGLLVAGFLVLPLFAWHENRRGHDAVVPTSLFKTRSFSAASFLVLMAFSALSSAFLVVVWFTQIALGWSSMRTSYALVGFVIGLALVGGWGAMRIDKFGRGTVAIGLVVLAAGMALLAWVINVQGADVRPWQLLLAFAPTGAGTALVIGILVNAQLYDVPADDAGAAGGVLSATIQLAGGIGVSIVAIIFFGLLASGAPSHADQAVAGLRSALSAGPSADRDRIVGEFRTCVIDQARSADPYEAPASCRLADLQQPVVRAAIDRAHLGGFAKSATETLLRYQVLVLLLAVPLSRSLPARKATNPLAAANDGAHDGDQPAANAAADGKEPASTSNDHEG